MKIWIDADASPKAVKQIVFKAAQKRKIYLTLVANNLMNVPDSEYIDAIQVEKGFDVADNYILNKAEKGDIIITADIPLASDVIEKGCHVIDPRGKIYTKENIRDRLAVRDIMDNLRSTGVETGGPPAYSERDKREFANQLYKLIQDN